MLVGKQVTRPFELVHEQIADQARQAPEAIALVYEDSIWTYRELNERANRLAHFLQRSGIKPGNAVGICIRRSPELIVSVLGVLKSGGCYLPLDATYPAERIAMMVSEVTNLQLVLMTSQTRGFVPDGSHVFCLDEDWDKLQAEPTTDPARVNSAEDLAYVVFTSGSTGRPKGTAVRHNGWSNLLYWFVTEFAVSRSDRSLLVSSFGFDITQRSIAMPLIAGGQLHIFPETQFDSGKVLNTLRRSEITLINCSPSLLYPVIQGIAASVPPELRSLRCVFLGGEPISSSRIEAWARRNPTTAIVNVYGTAECSDVSTAYRLHDYARYAQNSVPLGTAIYNSTVYVADESLKEVPDGQIGEICLCGIGVGAGYVNDSAMTRQRFLQGSPEVGPDLPLYRTGDLGKILPDGTLGFGGRVDHQVKIRGMRIDLGDIEAAMRRCAGVREAVVIKQVFKDGDERLVAFIVEHDPPPLVQGSDRVQRTAFSRELRTALKDMIPGHMVPNLFFTIEALPLNAHGKVDREALARLQIRSAD